MTATSVTDESIRDNVSLMTLNDFNEKPNPNKGKNGKKKSKKKTKKKQKQKKLKKQRKAKVQQYSSEIEIAERKANTGQLLADILTNAKVIRVVGEGIYLYDEDIGYFALSNKQRIQTKLKSWVRKNIDEYHKCNMRDYDEAYKMLLLDEEIQTEELDKAFNKPYILCRNGVLHLREMKLHKLSPKYEFTSCINAKFDTEAKGEVFEDFLDYATEGDTSMKTLIQELMGYALSNYVNIRKAFMFVGVPGTSKSTILNIIRNIVGEDNCAAVNIQDIENEYYVAELLRNKLNIAPDLPNELLRTKYPNSSH